jgi:hypothetical protein
VCLSVLVVTLTAVMALRRSQPQTAPRAASAAPLTAASPRTQEPPRPTAGAAADERKVTTREAAKSSRRIVLARCRAVDVREVAGGNIFTFYEFDVLEELKGGAGEAGLTLRLLGGRVGNAEVTRVLDVDFVPARKYVLLLGEENVAGYPTISAQSVFQVMTSPLDKSEVISPPPTGMALYKAQGGRKYSATPELLPLEDFLLSLKKL